MKVYNSISSFSINSKTIITVGTFDGVHIGHKCILNHLRKISKKKSGESVLLTFSPHPRHVLQPENLEPKLINTIEEKKVLLENAGIDHLIIQKFTKDFSRKKSVNFVRDILVDKLNVSHLIIGHDHQFGRNREGSLKELRLLSELYNFQIDHIPSKSRNNVTVSSTKIREALLIGNIDLANKYLGYLFHFTAEVISGKSIGKNLGFPTANLKLEDKLKIIIGKGVYLVKVRYDFKQYYGMMNIGVKPTFKEETESIEVHIFDFNIEIYGAKLYIEVVKRLRDEKEFKSVKLLKEQLKKDYIHAKDIIRTI